MAKTKEERQAQRAERRFQRAERRALREFYSLDEALVYTENVRRLLSDENLHSIYVKSTNIRNYNLLENEQTELKYDNLENGKEFTYYTAIGEASDVYENESLRPTVVEELSYSASPLVGFTYGSDSTAHTLINKQLETNMRVMKKNSGYGLDLFSSKTLTSGNSLLRGIDYSQNAPNVVFASGYEDAGDVALFGNNDFSKLDSLKYFYVNRDEEKHYGNLGVTTKTRIWNAFDIIKLPYKFSKKEVYLADGDSYINGQVRQTVDNVNNLVSFGPIYGEISAEQQNGAVKSIDKVGYSFDFGGNLIGKTKAQGKQTNDQRVGYDYYEETDTFSAHSIRKVNAYGHTVKYGTFDKPKGLLAKTNKLFKEDKIGSLINRFHTAPLKDISQFETSYTQHGISHGRNLLKEKYLTTTAGDITSGYDNPYCRVWTAHHQYSKMTDRIRPFVTEQGGFQNLQELHSKLGDFRANGGAERLAANTVLQDNGYLRINPQKVNGVNEGIKHYMFSIENLAWKDYLDGGRIGPEQRGPNGGRIMWFPPYDLTFNEDVSVQWNANEFIGRGEKIYTYTNTERKGRLSFTLLIDHPSVVDKWTSETSLARTEEQEQAMLRFFAGCGLGIFDDLKNQNPTISVKLPEKQPPVTPPTTPEPKDENGEFKVKFVMFFPNDYSAKDYSDKKYGADLILSAKTDYYPYELEDVEENGWGKALLRDKNKNGEILYTKNLTDDQNYKLNSEAGKSDKDAKIREILGISAEDKLYSFYDLYRYVNEEQSYSKFFADFISDEVDPANYTLEAYGDGFASSHGYLPRNLELGTNRASLVAGVAKKSGWFEKTDYKDTQALFGEKYPGQSTFPSSRNSTDNGVNAEFNIINVLDEEKGKEDIENLVAKIGRSAVLTVTARHKSTAPTKEEGVESYDFSEYGETLEAAVVTAERPKAVALTYAGVNDDMITYDNEYQYFNKLEKDDHLSYSRVVDKVKYFQPAFHSVSPEGFNARLNFLHQCTRQGPTVSSPDNQVNGVTNTYAGNLAFGRPPFCILRIGDFYHTKICIDNISIQYEADGKVQWDLNPEGAGVQPMFAKIDLGFTFLGGQDLTGPIEQLQTAVSSNFLANTSIYDRNSDFWTGTGDTKDIYSRSMKKTATELNDSSPSKGDTNIEIYEA